jgi:hypothetical protein
MFPLIESCTRSESDALKLKLKVLDILRELLLGSSMQVLRPESSGIVQRLHGLLREAFASLKDIGPEADEERRKLLHTLVGLGLHHNSVVVLLQVCTSIVDLSNEHPSLQLSFEPFSELLSDLRMQAGVGRILFSESSRQASFLAMWSSPQFCPMLSGSEHVAAVSKTPAGELSATGSGNLMLARTSSSSSRLSPDWSVVRFSNIGNTSIPTPSIIGAIATDGPFLYARVGSTGLAKVGTGHGDTIRGHLYAFNGNFLPHLHVYLATFGDRLFARTRFMLDCFAHDVDKSTLQILGPLSTSGPLPKRFSFGDIADIFSDGDFLYVLSPIRLHYSDYDIAPT